MCCYVIQIARSIILISNAAFLYSLDSSISRNEESLLWVAVNNPVLIESLRSVDRAGAGVGAWAGVGVGVGAGTLREGCEIQFLPFSSLTI
jgi:hypothetical protein